MKNKIIILQEDVDPVRVLQNITSKADRFSYRSPVKETVESLSDSTGFQATIEAEEIQATVNRRHKGVKRKLKFCNFMQLK